MSSLRKGYVHLVSPKLGNLWELTCAQLLAVGAVPILAKLAIEDPTEPARRKAIYALSSEVRNYQPGLNEALKALPEGTEPNMNMDAGDMEAIDRLIDGLRESSRQKAS